MKSTITKSTLDAKITEFISLWQQGIDAWIKAGEILVELVENDPHTYDYIIQKCPLMNAGILGRFEQIGRKILHPQLLLTASPGFAKLKRLPISLQERYLDEPIPIVVQTDDGTDVLLVQAKNMTKDQADQVFTSGRVRTEGEQKAWLMDMRSKMAKPCNKVDRVWTVKGGKAIINGVEFTRKEIVGILSAMD
jgi:hypothetical protein